MTLSSSLLLLFIFFVLSFEWAGRKWGIPAIPTLPWQRRVMIQMLQKYIPPESTPHIIELGCGWGGLMVALARTYPQARITGYEGYPPAAFMSRFRCGWHQEVQVHRRDFFTADLSLADVIVCYLSHDLMKRLQPKFNAQLKPGTLIVSNAFPLPDWTPIDRITTRKIVPLHVWVYRKS